MVQKFDLGIIGGGPAGYTAALKAREQGLSVVLFEKDKLGGVCLNKGCIPTKAILHSAELYEEMKRVTSYDYKKNGNSSGKLPSIPNIGLYPYVPIQAYGAPADNSDCGRQDYLTSRQVSTVSDMGSSSASILYEKVAETVTNDSLAMGKTVYYYQVNFTASDSLLLAGDDVFVKKTHCNHTYALACPPHTNCTGPFYIGRHLDATPNFPYPIVSWHSGFLTKVEQFDNEDRPVESVEYKYRLKPQNDSILYIQAKFLEKYTDTWKLYNPLDEVDSYEFVYQYDILWGGVITNSQNS